MSATLALIERLTYKTVHNKRRNYAPLIALTLGAFFRAQALRVGQHVDEMTLASSNSIFDQNSDVDHNRLAYALMLAFLGGMQWGAKRYDTGFVYDENTPVVTAYRNRVLTLVTQLNETTKNDITNVLTASFDAELTQPQTIKAIKQLFVSYGTTRSLHAGAYESLLAFNQGNFQAIVDTGTAYDKLWLTAGDDRVEQECLDNAAQGWVPLQTTYTTGSQYPPEHIGCRCALDFRKA